MRFSVGERALTLDAKLGMIPSLFIPEIWHGGWNRSQKYVIEVWSCEGNHKHAIMVKYESYFFGVFKVQIHHHSLMKKL